MVTDITTARTLFVRDCPVRATFVEWGENILRIGGHESGGNETKGREWTSHSANSSQDSTAENADDS